MTTMSTPAGQLRPLARLLDEPRRARSWRLVACLMLAAWLIGSPWGLGHAGSAQAISDQLAGVVIILLAIATHLTNKAVLGWGIGGVGLWLVLSPILFWAPTLAAFASATVVGSLVTTLAFIIPVTRGTSGPAVPDGWSYNPSAWSQRLPVIVLSAVSYLAALYMTAFQLGYIDTVVDPLFGNGTQRVLMSSVSRAFPVSDAGLGAATYLIDLAMTCAGDRSRWRTLPWLVIVFGILIVPVGIVSVVLVMLQPIAVGAWCTWCLVTAVATLAMVPLAIDEVAATLQRLRRAARSGRSWTAIIWRGDTEGAVGDRAPPRAVPRRAPLGIVLAAATGLWLVLERYALGTSGTYAASCTITGALTIVVAAIAASEIARPLRLAFVPIGVWAVLAPWLVDGATPTAHLSGPLAGMLQLSMALPRGPVHQRHAELDRVALWPDLARFRRHHDLTEGT
jgi:uncharacterized membrane protein